MCTLGPQLQLGAALRGEDIDTFQKSRNVSMNYSVSGGKSFAQGSLDSPLNGPFFMPCRLLPLIALGATFSFRLTSVTTGAAFTLKRRTFYFRQCTQ